MHFKDIKIGFLISLISAVVLRTLQIVYSIDSVTGFFKPQYKIIGLIITVVIFAAVIVQSAITLSVRRCPVSAPKTSKLRGVASILIAASAVLGLFYMPKGIPAWQSVLVVITSIGLIGYFVALAVKSFFNFHIPRILSIIPSVAFLARLIAFFTSTSTIALITSNIFVMAALIFVSIFFFQYARLINKIKTDSLYKIICFTGFASVTFCAIASISPIIAFIVKPSSVSASNFLTAVPLLFVGSFICVFLMEYFALSNLKSKKKYRSSRKIMESDFKNDFYVGNK